MSAGSVLPVFGMEAGAAKLARAAGNGAEVAREVTLASRPEQRLLAGAVDAVADHHLFPRQFRSFFVGLGIDIDRFTVTIPHKSVHLRGIHGNGLGSMPGGWNARWAEFIETKPTVAETWQFAGKLMDEFGLSGLPIHP